MKKNLFIETYYKIKELIEVPMSKINVCPTEEDIEEQKIRNARMNILLGKLHIKLKQ